MFEPTPDLAPTMTCGAHDKAEQVDIHQPAGRVEWGSGSLLPKDIGSCSIDRSAISYEAKDSVRPDALHALAPHASSVLCILDVALAGLCKEEARALGRGCQHIHQRAMAGISPSIAHKHNACVFSFLPVQLQVCIHPLTRIPQQPVPERIVPWACIPFPILPQALREAAPAG